jgi:hypothetical protein
VGLIMKCKIYSYFDYTGIEQIVMHFYEKYEVIDVKFSTAIDVTFNRVNYTVMIIYEEKQ